MDDLASQPLDPNAAQARRTSVTACVQAAFDEIAGATQILRRMAASTGRTAWRAPLGRLLSVSQARDAFDQRISHIETAADRLQSTPDTLLAEVIALQGSDLGRMLDEAGSEAEAAFGALSTEGTTEAEEHTQRGTRAAAELLALAPRLGEVWQALPAEAGDAGTQVDLGWLEALYTTDDERRVHRMALARAGAGAL